ncbi:hypothetical protein BDZ45DRAFT_719066 [Acephala macrosclerotiorum]|nr:hypothetical protein BDZ45DRAFT_719066 [Acephala macrosclerotiorum]
MPLQSPAKSIRVTMSNLLRGCRICNIIAVVILPLVGILLSPETPFTTKTKIWTLVYYFISGIGVTARYHRLWSHRSYDARLSLQVYLAIAGAAYPYSISKGLWHAHTGWLFSKPTSFPDQIEMTDLDNNKVVLWQHRNFATTAIVAGVFSPALVAGVLWDDWKGGFVYAGILRIFFFQQSTFCVNSLAHPYDNKHSPRDHSTTALVTFGEGYHNFHHKFPSDYPNRIKWHQYDPWKWSIWIWSKMRLASRLKTSSQDVIRKGEY